MQLQLHRLQITSLLLILFLFATAHAQTFRGGINGAILDPTGAAVANASITATNSATGVHTNGITTSSGEFLFQDLPLGDYGLTITAPGFAKTRVDHVTVSAGTSPHASYQTRPQLHQRHRHYLCQQPRTRHDSLYADHRARLPHRRQHAAQRPRLHSTHRAHPRLHRLLPRRLRLAQRHARQPDGLAARRRRQQRSLAQPPRHQSRRRLRHRRRAPPHRRRGSILRADTIRPRSRTQSRRHLSTSRSSPAPMPCTGHAYYFNRNELFGAASPFSPTKQKVRHYNAGFSVGGPAHSRQALRLPHLRAHALCHRRIRHRHRAVHRLADEGHRPA